MGRRAAALAVVMLAALPAAVIHAQALARLGVGLSSYPEDGGTVTEGYLSWRVSDAWSVLLKARQVSTSIEDGFMEPADSLRVTGDSVTEAFLYPVRWRPASLPLTLSLGGYLSAQDTGERGYFESETSGLLHSYVNDFSVLFYGPALGVALDLTAGFLRLYLDLMAVPVFFFNADQAVAIEPLIALGGSHAQTGMGWPYVAVRLVPTLFGLVAPVVQYEFRAFTLERLVGKADLSGWTTETAANSAHTLTVRLCLNLPLFERGSFRLGYGRVFEWLSVSTAADTEPRLYTESRGTLEFSFVMSN